MFASIVYGLALMTILLWAFWGKVLSPEVYVCVCVCSSQTLVWEKHSHKPRELTANIQPSPMTFYSLQKRSPFSSLPSSPCEFVVKIPGSAKSSSVQTLSSHYKELELGIDRHRGSSLAFDSSMALFLKVALLLWTCRKCRVEEKKRASVAVV